MKYVSFLFALALASAATFAHAAEKKVTFNYTNHYAYYACSYAESQMGKTLVALGAQDVAVDCNGGIEFNQMWPISMTATFTHDAKGARTVVLRGRDACDFNVQLIKTVLKSVEHTVLKERHFCRDGQGNYFFEIGLN